MHTGSCLCGEIKFEIQQPLEPIQICHCSQCRKAQGSAFVTNIPIQEVNFKVLSGEERLTGFESSPGKQRVFCRQCGSPVYSKTSKLPGVLRVRAGTIDGELPVKPAFHIYWGSKANWYDADDNLPAFDELPPPLNNLI